MGVGAPRALPRSFVPAFSDSYRYVLIAAGDDDTDRGSSGWISLRVRR